MDRVGALIAQRRQDLPNYPDRGSCDASLAQAEAGALHSILLDKIR